MDLGAVVCGYLHLVSERKKVDGEWVKAMRWILAWVRMEARGQRRGWFVDMGGRSFVTERRNLATGWVVGAEI